MTWTPGFPLVGCETCWQLLDDVARHRPTRPCAGCSAPVEHGHGHAVYAAGPVIVQGNLCPECAALAQPQPDPEQADARLEAVRSLAAALQDYWGDPLA